MTIKQISDKVRIVYEGRPFNANDISVEQLVDGVWIKTVSFDSMSDDFAYTHASDTARKIAQIT